MGKIDRIKTINNLLEKVELAFLSISILLIPNYGKLIPAFMVLWFVFSLVNFIKSDKKTVEKPNKYVFFGLLLFPIFYFVHILGLIYTENIDFALFDLEVKISFILIPLIVYLRYGFIKKHIIFILEVFVLGVTISFIYKIIIATNNYFISGGETKYFYYTYLSKTHPTYISMYATLAFFIIAELFNKMSKLKKYIYSVNLIILIVYILLLISKGVIIAFLICLFVYLFIKLIPKIGLLKLILLLLIIFSTILYSMYKMPLIHTRFYALKFALSKKDLKHVDIYESTGTRMFLFSAGINVIKDTFPFGTGTGDIKDELNKELYKLVNIPGFDKTYNAHNQFFQSLIALGLLGLISLMLIFVYGFYFSIKYKDYIFLMFLGMLFLVFLTESIIEVQGGTIYCSLFYSLLFLRKV